MSESLLEVSNLKKYFGPVKAVDDVSFTVKKGETLGVVGESGCGKTTLGRTILKLMEPTDGKIYINTSLGEGEPIKRYDISAGERLRDLRKKMQIVYQDPASSLDPRMIIRDLISEPLKTHKIVQGRGLVERVVELLRQVGLQEEHLWRYPYELSGGQRQRVAIARAISLNPDFIVLDEPTSALDVSVQAKILKLLNKLQNDLNLTYLFITHDMGVIDYMCDRVMVMYVGKIVEVCEKNRLFNTPLHPYAKALLSAVPSKNPEKRKLSMAEILPGDVASPDNPPSGCRFHPRCRYAFNQCGWSASDLVHYIKDNLDEEINNKVKIDKSSQLEIFYKENDANRVTDEKLNKIIEKGKKEKTPLFEVITELKKERDRIFISFEEVKIPELIEREQKEHYVACLLYTPLQNSEDKKLSEVK